MKGDIVLVPFPNSDLTPGKLRPALILHEDAIENETTIAYISSNKITTMKTNFIAGLLGCADEALQAEVDKGLNNCLKFKASH